MQRSLAPLGALIERLAASATATKFYSFSSHEWFCFSASSHYPWVNEGLPAIARMDAESFLIRIPGHPECVMALEPTVQRVEAALASCPVIPFFGSADNLALRLFAEELKRQGSELRPELVRVQGWPRVVVADHSGLRRCVLSARGSHHGVEVIEAERKSDTAWDALDEAVRAVRRFCEEGAEFEDVTATRTAPAGPRG